MNRFKNGLFSTGADFKTSLRLKLRCWVEVGHPVVVKCFVNFRFCFLFPHPSLLSFSHVFFSSSLLSVSLMLWMWVFTAWRFLPCDTCPLLCQVPLSQSHYYGCWPLGLFPEIEIMDNVNSPCTVQPKGPGPPWTAMGRWMAPKILGVWNLSSTFAHKMDSSVSWRRKKEMRRKDGDRSVCMRIILCLCDRTLLMIMTLHRELAYNIHRNSEINNHLKKSSLNTTFIFYFIPCYFLLYFSKKQQKLFICDMKL